MISLAALAVFSGLSLNLFINFAIGVSSIVTSSAGKRGKNESFGQLPVFQLLVLFLAVIFLWLIFSLLPIPGILVFMQYFLFFPLSAIVCMGLELLGERIFGKNGIKKIFSSFTAYDGLVPASLIIAFTLANNFSGVLVLALFFSLGNLFSIMILNEIRRRSAFEMVPRHLRGSPLILISMGLLSLITVTAAVIFFRILVV